MLMYSKISIDMVDMRVYLLGDGHSHGRHQVRLVFEGAQTPVAGRWAWPGDCRKNHLQDVQVDPGTHTNFEDPRPTRQMRLEHVNQRLLKEIAQDFINNGHHVVLISPEREMVYPCPFTQQGLTKPCAVSRPQPGVWEINVSNNGVARTFDPSNPVPLEATPVTVTATSTGDADMQGLQD